MSELFTNSKCTLNQMYEPPYSNGLTGRDRIVTIKELLDLPDGAYFPVGNILKRTCELRLKEDKNLKTETFLFTDNVGRNIPYRILASDRWCFDEWKGILVEEPGKYWTNVTNVAQNTNELVSDEALTQQSTAVNNLDSVIIASKKVEESLPFNGVLDINLKAKTGTRLIFYNNSGDRLFSVPPKLEYKNMEDYEILNIKLLEIKDIILRVQKRHGISDPNLFEIFDL